MVICGISTIKLAKKRVSFLGTKNCVDQYIQLNIYNYLCMTDNSSIFFPMEIEILYDQLYLSVVLLFVYQVYCKRLQSIRAPLC